MTDPMSVACPLCASQPGEKCRSVNRGWTLSVPLDEPHEARKLLAMERDNMQGEHVASDALIDRVAGDLV